MVNEDVLVGAEESGGLAIKGHIPERDGIWIGLTIWEYMSKTGKSLDELIQEVYGLVGSFAVERYDLHIREDQKQQIIEPRSNDQSPVEIRCRGTRPLYRWKGRPRLHRQRGSIRGLGTIRGRAVLRNPGMFPTPGMFGNMRLSAGGTAQALLIRIRPSRHRSGAPRS